MKKILQAHGVCKNFGGLKALRDLDFELREGEILGLIGPNGSGKTTLFNVINGFYSPDKGKVEFKGKNITGLRPDQICRLGIGRTFQLIHPFKSLNVFENVKVGAFFGKKERGSSYDQGAKIASILKSLDLEKKQYSKIDSLTICDIRHLELAKAMATEPEVILLDEVLAGLTPVETGELMDTVRKIRERGITVFMIEHIMKAVMGLSDRVIVLEFGRKIAEGIPSDVVKNQSVIKAYLGEEDVL